MQLPIVGVAGRRHLQRPVVRDPEALEPGGPVLDRQGALGLEERLAVTGGLPELGEVVPLVVGVGDVGDVGRPRAHPVAVGGGDPEREDGAPVVADEVDRAVDAGRARRAASRRSRPWWRRSPSGRGLPKPGSDRATDSRSMRCADAVPDGGRLGDAVHEDDHGADATAVARLPL